MADLIYGLGKKKSARRLTTAAWRLLIRKSGVSKASFSCRDSTKNDQALYAPPTSMYNRW